MNASPTQDTGLKTQDSFSEARELQWMWKSPAMAAMAVMICRVALERGAQGEFSANDLPAHKATAHGGSGIAGSIFKRLAKDDVLCPVGLFVDGLFMQKVTFNAGGNRIGLWRLKNAARAQRLIRVHTARADATKELKQAELPVA
jgi:hypothetical protein